METIFSMFQQMVLASGKRTYKPNAIVIFKERTFIPVSRTGFVNPLYNNADRLRLFENELDERAYERTILRNSPFFERMRKVRMNINASGPYILGETKLCDIPDYRTREKLSDGYFELFEKDGEICKRLLIPEEGLFEFYGDGSANWMYASELTPHITLKEGESICGTVSPITDILTSYGENGTRLCRFYTAESVNDGFTENGGKASLSFSAYAYGMGMEHVDISLEVILSGQEKEEIHPLGAFEDENFEELDRRLHRKFTL